MGPKLTTVFASRWRALWFAAMVLVTAYYVAKPDAPPPGDPAQAQAAGDAEMEQLKSTLNAVEGFSEGSNQAP